MLEKIEKPELETVELRSDGKYGKFVLAPLAARCRSQLREN